MKPRMFIASSVDHLDLAYAAQEGLEHDVESTVWSQGVFAISRTAMASLVDQLDESDFGLFILAPSDITDMKAVSKKTVRDNVIFELGLFIGRLGIDRCFLVLPRGSEDLHLPTDLLGITAAAFDSSRQDQNLVAALGPACSKIRKAVAKLGMAIPVQAAAVPVEAEPQTLLCMDPEDCKALIQSWMGNRASSKNTEAIRYSDVDRDLGLIPGSAKQYIEEVARHWRYVPARKGQETILFEEGRRVRSRPEFF